MSYSIRTRLHHWIEQCPCTNFLVKNKKEQEQVDGIWYDVVVVECLEKAEVQQSPKREGRNMIMFLTPRKTPLIKKETETVEPKKALRTIN